MIFFFSENISISIFTETIRLNIINDEYKIYYKLIINK